MITLVMLALPAAAIAGPTNSSPAKPPVVAPALVVTSVLVQSGDLISVQIQGDIGSRISNEGDTFAVVTVEDYYVKGNLVLPKGSPGYGAITHIKRAGSWHAGGELTFTVKRLIGPDGTTVATEINGATADADKQSEKNGNEVGQYLLFGGLGIFTHRGNDILIKNNTIFHVSTSESKQVPTVVYGTAPSTVNAALVTIHPPAAAQ